MKSTLNLAPGLRDACLRLAKPFPLEQIPSLQVAVRDYGATIVKESKRIPFMDVPLALSLCDLAVSILERYPSLEPESQELAAAAVKYFLMRDDELNGFTSPGGFEDDALVLREVAQHLVSSRST